MKKISTLGFSILFSIASFAGTAPNRLTVAAEGNVDIKVTVDGGRFDQQVDNSMVFNNLTPGYHSVKIFQFQEKHGRFGRNAGNDYQLVYSGSVNIKPLFETSIVLNRFGKADVDEKPMRGFNNAWKNDGYLNRKGDYSNYRQPGTRDDEYKGNSYGKDYYNNDMVRGDDFFALKRTVERESFDNSRLVIAKHIADVYTLTSVQVKEMAQLFSFDNSRLDFVKYAYNKTCDKNNYAVVCDAFSYSNSRNQLMDYLKSCR